MNNSQPPEKTVYRFDDYVVDTNNFVVKRRGETLTVTPRAFDVLSLLLLHRGQVVEKRQLFDEIWGETFVSDNALTKVVKELRHALEDSVEQPRYIETIPKRGYRFIAPVDQGSTEIANAESPAETPHRRLSPILSIIGMSTLLVLAIAAIWVSLNRNSGDGQPLKTIAVLPFKPLDKESRDESLELGMAETLITRLSNLNAVVVRPMGSVRKFTDLATDPVEAGKQLQAEAVVDGSIQKVNDRVRMTVRLIDVRTGASIWTEQFDDTFTDIFRVQDSIAERIVGAMALRLSRSEQERLAKHMTDSPEAYELYIRGQFNWHRRGQNWIQESIEAYKQALEKDPNFALAHIGLAEGYIMLSGHRRMSVADAASKAEPHITRALEIDNSLAQAHNVLAEFKYQYQYDWQGAESEFKTAINLNPNVAWIHQAYGWYLMSDGRFDEANAEMEKARQLDPSSMTLLVARGRLYYFSRQYDRAIEIYREMLTREPNDPSVHHALYTVYVQKGMYAEAVDMFLKNQRAGGMPENVEQGFREAFATGGWEGYQRKVLAERERHQSSSPAFPARWVDTYVHLGDKEKAFYWLEKIFDARDISILQFKIEPAYDLLRDDPRYAQLLARIGQKP